MRRRLFGKIVREVTYTYSKPTNISLSYGTVPVGGVTLEDGFLPYYTLNATKTGSDGSMETVTIRSTDDDKCGLEMVFSIVPDGRNDVSIDSATGALIVGSAEEISGGSYYGVGTVTMTAGWGSDTTKGEYYAEQALNTVQEVTSYSIDITRFDYDAAPVEGTDNLYPNLDFTVTEKKEYSDGSPSETSVDNVSYRGGQRVSGSEWSPRFTKVSGEFGVDSSTGRVYGIGETEESGDENIELGEVRVDIDIASYASASATTKVYQGVNEVPVPDAYSAIRITDFTYNNEEDLSAAGGEYKPTLHFEQDVLNLDGSVKETIKGYMTPEGNDIPEGAEIVFAMNPSGEGELNANVDKTTGLLSIANNNDDVRLFLGTVKVEITMNGVTGEKESNELWIATAAEEPFTGWGYPEVQLELEGLDWRAYSMITISPTIRQYYYEDGEIAKTKTDGFDVKYDFDIPYDYEFDPLNGEFFINEANESSSSRILGQLTVTATGEENDPSVGGLQTSLTVNVVQKGQTTTYNPSANATASKYGVRIGNVSGATVSYLNVIADRTETDANGNETVVEEGVCIMTLGEDNGRQEITSGATFYGSYTSGIACGTYRPKKLEALALDAYNHWVTNYCDAGNFQSQCPYTGDDLEDCPSIPSTQYTNELTNIEIGNDGPNALINIINLSWSS